MFQEYIYVIINSGKIQRHKHYPDTFCLEKITKLSNNKKKTNIISYSISFSTSFCASHQINIKSNIYALKNGSVTHFFLTKKKETKKNSVLNAIWCIICCRPKKKLNIKRTVSHNQKKVHKLEICNDLHFYHLLPG